MAKDVTTVHIVNPKDPSDARPQIANVVDANLNGWTLWIDRHGPDHMAKVEAANAAGKEPKVEKPKEDKPKVEKPKEDKPKVEKPEGEGSAVKPSEIKKAPGK